MSGLRFGAIIVTSIAVIHRLMYVNTFELAHVLWSETHLFMTPC